MLARRENLWPITELRALARTMDRIFEDLFGEEESVGAWLPEVDVYETEDAHFIKVDLPGVDPKDVKVEVRDNVLTISGSRTEEREQQSAHFHRRERYTGSFQRSFQLPSTVDTQKIEAEYRNGVLTIRLPKVQEARAREIRVKHAK